MNIQQHLDNGTLTLVFEGRMDSATAPQFARIVSEQLAGVHALVLDFGFLDYISSAGLRVILNAQNLMEDRGGMKVIRANETIMEIFAITGFTDLLTIE